MLDNLKKRIQQLIALYEAERTERIKLQIELEKYSRQCEAYKAQMTELERQIDNLKLTKAFVADSSDNEQARKKIDKLMKEIDRCISLMEG
jgi:phage shock protein A